MLTSKFWVRISIFNLLIIAILGVLMRYKIGFEFPFFDQKNLQYGHSQFAFCGWVSQILMFSIFHFIQPLINSKRIKKYNLVFILNLVAAYGMLVSFILQGYRGFSIFFTLLSVVVSYVFVSICYSDFTRLKIHHPAILWFKASLLFNLLSSFGTFALAYMMATKNLDQHNYLASMYWFLHFQYNGWFFFACAGLFVVYLKNNFLELQISDKTFWLFAASCIPAYGLSILWMDLPLFIYILVAAGAIAQALGWIKLLQTLKRINFLRGIAVEKLIKYLFIAIALSLTVKLSLQLGSTIPAISKLAFGFRPIVIAYLHLVLLAFTSVFIISHLFNIGLLERTKKTSAGIAIAAIGIFLNELVLAVQGIASFKYHVIPYTNEILFIISLLILTGLLILFVAQFKKKVSPVFEM